MAGQNNPYFVLGIFDFDHPLIGDSDDDRQTKDAIDKAAKTKQESLSIGNSSLFNGHSAIAEGDAVSAAREQLSTLEGRRAAWKAAEREAQRAIADETRKRMMKGYVLETEIDDIASYVAEILGTPVSGKQVREHMPGDVEIRSGAAAGAGGGRSRAVPKPKKSFALIDGDLKVCGCADLYDLLATERTIDGVTVGGHSAPGEQHDAAQWHAWADEDKKRLPTTKTPRVSALAKLYAQCDKAFADEAAREQYDDWLTYRALQDALDTMARTYKYVDQVTVDDLERFAPSLMAAGPHNGLYQGRQVTHEDAIAYLRGQCAKSGLEITVVQKIPQPQPQPQPEPEPQEDKAPATDIPVDKEHFPDERFRAYVEKELDRDHDGILSAQEIAAVTRITLPHAKIKKMKGIEFFPRLQQLDVSLNDLRSLDLSHNPALTTLDASGTKPGQSLSQRSSFSNQLGKLDLSHNPALTTLVLRGSGLKLKVDLSRNVRLQKADLSGNSIKAVILPRGDQLSELDLSSNQLGSLDLSGCEGLTVLNVRHNSQLHSLDTSHNPLLSSLTKDPKLSVDTSHNPLLHQEDAA